MSRNAKVIVEAENRTGAGIKAAAQTINGFGRDVEKIGKLISKAFVVTAVVDFGKKVASVAADMESAWAAQEKALLGFEAAMRGAAQISSAGASELKAFAQTMAALVGVDDQVILSLETFLATSGRTEAQIKSIISAAADMSAATGKDLKSSVEQLNKTFGGTAGELGEILPAMKSLTKEQLLAGDAVKLVSDQYKGMADAMSGSVQVSIDNYKNAVGDLKEEIGGLISLGLSPLRDWLTDIVRQWAAATGSARLYAETQAKVRGGASLDTLNKEQLEALNKQRRVFIEERKSRLVMLKEGSEDHKTVMAQIEKAQEEQRRIAQQLIDIAANDRYLSYNPGPAPDKPKAGGASSKGTGESAQSIEWESFLGKFKSQNNMGWRPVDAGIDDVMDAYRGGGGGGDRNSISVFGDMSPLSLFLDGIGDIASPLSALGGSLSMIMQIMDPMSLIIKSFFETIGPALEQTIKPLYDAISDIGVVLAESLFPILNSLAPLFSITADILGRWIAPVLNMIAPVIELIAGILNLTLAPLLKLVSIEFEILSAPVKWVGDLLKWMGEQIQIFVYNLTNPIWEADKAHTGFSSDAFSGLAERIAKIWNTSYGGGLTPGASPSGKPSSSASYSGAQSLTFNFYNQGNVVGSGGLEELALVIDSILKRNARYA